DVAGQRRGLARAEWVGDEPAGDLEGEIGPPERAEDEAVVGVGEADLLLDRPRRGRDVDAVDVGDAVHQAEQEQHHRGRANFHFSTSMAASTPPLRPSAISTPASVPHSIRSLNQPRWPIRKTWLASFPRPVPSEGSKRRSAVSRTRSASAHTTAVTAAECSRSSAQSTSSPQPRTDARVAFAWRAWRAKTFSSPSSSSIRSDSRRP